MSRRVGLGHSPVQLTCRVRGEMLFWRVNDVTHYNYYLHSNSREFNERGIFFMHVSTSDSVITESVTVTLNRTNNNTVIDCVATSGLIAIVSNVSTIFIAGKL